MAGVTHEDVGESVAAGAGGRRRDNLNAHVSAAMAELIAARDWPTVCQLPPYAHELTQPASSSSAAVRPASAVRRRKPAMS